MLFKRRPKDNSVRAKRLVLTMVVVVVVVVAVGLLLVQSQLLLTKLLFF